MTPDGRPFYVDHNTRTTHWVPPAPPAYEDAASMPTVESEASPASNPQVPLQGKVFPAAHIPEPAKKKSFLGSWTRIRSDEPNTHHLERQYYTSDDAAVDLLRMMVGKKVRTTRRGASMGWHGRVR